MRPTAYRTGNAEAAPRDARKTMQGLLSWTATPRADNADLKAHAAIRAAFEAVQMSEMILRRAYPPADPAMAIGLTAEGPTAGYVDQLRGLNLWR